MKHGRPPRFTDQELALAYELRTEGCRWKAIARGLGTNENSIMRAVHKRINRK